MTVYMVTGNAREARDYLQKYICSSQALDDLIETGSAYYDGALYHYYELEDYGDNDGVMVKRRVYR